MQTYLYTPQRWNALDRHWESKRKSNYVKEWLTQLKNKKCMKKVLKKLENIQIAKSLVYSFNNKVSTISSYVYVLNNSKIRPHDGTNIIGELWLFFFKADGRLLLLLITYCPNHNDHRHEKKSRNHFPSVSLY